jgi:hypothetical protein
LKKQIGVIYRDRVESFLFLSFKACRIPKFIFKVFLQTKFLSKDQPYSLVRSFFKKRGTRINRFCLEKTQFNFLDIKSHEKKNDLLYFSINWTKKKLKKLFFCLMTPWWGRFAILPSHVLSFCTFLHAGTASPARVAEKKYFWVIESTYLLQKNLTFLNHPSCGQMKISSSFVDQLSVCGNGFAENNIVVVVIFSNFAFVTIF